MTEHRPTPGKEEIALLETFERLGLGQIQLVSTPEQAAQALKDLAGETALGFDTESKPTFAKNEASDGPHIVQLSTLDRAWIFQLTDAASRRAVALLLESPAIIKAGFGLGDDRRRIIHKLGVDLQGVLELNAVFREQGYRKDMGVKGAVAVLFNKRFIKSKKASTSNWANARLSEAQLVYAGMCTNDLITPELGLHQGRLFSAIGTEREGSVPLKLGAFDDDLKAVRVGLDTVHGG